MTRGWSLVLCLLNIASFGQEKETEISSIVAQQVESLSEKDDSRLEDDEFLQRLMYYRKHPLNLNRAEADGLRELMLLNELQIQRFLTYRRLLGPLISIYELQAVPGWDVETIRSVLPYITLQESFSSVAVGTIFREGDKSLLVRVGANVKYPNEVPGNNNWKGSNTRVLFRYRFQYKNELQWGILGDKDAGEAFFREGQRLGFDFYSIHFFVRKKGRLNALAVGDYSVNMGQGLIQWQNFALRKTGNSIAINRHAPVIRPYTSAGEDNFHRGIGISLRFNQILLTTFVSHRHLNATMEYDSATQTNSIATIAFGGYHRSSSELAKKNAASLLTIGGNIQWRRNRFQLGLNGIRYQYSDPLRKDGELYNLFEPSGRKFFNFSGDYHYTFRNVHFFGELATDKNLHTAFVQGFLMSLDSKLDLSILYRNIHKAYQSFYSGAFTENTRPVNEKGLYTGILLRLMPGWQINAYADLYRFPWLKFRINAPSFGKEYLLQLEYKRKRMEAYTRFKFDSGLINVSKDGIITEVISIIRSSWRTNVSFHPGGQWNFRNRVEMLWYCQAGGTSPETGYLVNSDVILMPIKRAITLGLRLQYCETAGFNSRIYAYENDVLFSFSAPPFAGKSLRWYVNTKIELNELFRWRTKWKLTTWFKLAQTLEVGNLDKLLTDWKFQFMVSG